MTTRGGAARFESRKADWVTVQDARTRILRTATQLPGDLAPVERALGRVLAAPLSARATMPPWDNSAMDGYAVRSQDISGASDQTPASLKVIGRVHAGDAHQAPIVGEGQTVRIMTGAPLPPGADAVVRVEDTDQEQEGDDRVRIRISVESGRYVRPGGEDFRAGEEVLRAGRLVSPGVVGLAAALGHAEVPVHRRPTVALLATGDELRGLDRYDDVIAGRGIPESNTPMLAAMVRESGATVGRAAVGRDDEDDLAARLDEAAAEDVLVTIGGASMGEADLVKRVLDRAGFRQDFWRVKIRPGSPFSFGHLPRGDSWQPVFGLPGNPSSAFVTFELFVRPFLRRLAGHQRCFRPAVTCIADRDLRGPDQLAAYLRVSLDRTCSPPRADLTGPQGSGLVRGLGDADGLAVLPVGTSEIPRGSEVRVMTLEGHAFDPLV